MGILIRRSIAVAGPWMIRGHQRGGDWALQNSNVEDGLVEIEDWVSFFAFADTPVRAIGVAQSQAR